MLTSTVFLHISESFYKQYLIETIFYGGKELFVKKLTFALGATITGMLNGLLGAGGGMVVVPMLNKRIDRKKAHATSVSIILPICISSAWSYLQAGKVTFLDVQPYIWWGVLGSILGAWLLPRIDDKLLKKAFSRLMIWAGVRLLLR